MSRPSAVLLDAAYTASSSTVRSAKTAPRPPRYSLNPLGSNSRRFVPVSHCEHPEYCQAYISAKQDHSQRTHHIVIADIPKTATPQDVLRALKQNNIVEKDFPISGITMPPPSCPRGPSLVKNVHLTMHDVDYDQAHHALKAMLSRPLFPDTSTWAQGSRPASNLGMRPHVPAYPIAFAAHQWVNGQLRSLPRGGQPDDGQSARAQERSEKGWKSETSRRRSELPTPEWSMDRRMRGRRVLLRGLPGLVQERRIRKAGGEYGVQPEQQVESEVEDVKRLPASAGSFTSTWVVTTDTVNNACRFVRKFNRQYWHQDTHGDKYLLRAEIVW